MLVTNVNIFTNDELELMIKDGAILIIGDEIIDVGSADILKKSYPNEEIYDGRGMLVVPGFVNAHLEVNLASINAPIFYNKNSSIFEYNRGMKKTLEQFTDEETLYIISQYAAFESIKYGITTIMGTFLADSSIEDPLEIFRSGVELLGLRVSMGRELGEINIKSLETNIKQIIEKFEKYKDNDHFKVNLPISAISLFSNEMLELLDSRMIDRIPNRVILDDPIAERKAILEKFGIDLFELLRTHKILKETSSVIYSGLIESVEIDSIASLNVNVVSTPRTQFIYGLDPRNIVELLGRGIKVGGGTGQLGFDITAEAKDTYIFQRHIRKTDNVAAVYELIKIFFKNNYEFASDVFNTNIGKIKPAYKADMVFLKPSTSLELDEEWIHRAIIFEILQRHNVDTVLIGGKIVMENGQIKNIESEEIYQNMRKISKKYIYNLLHN